MNPIEIDIEHYIQAMPQYREPLDFLQHILGFQASLVKKIEPGIQIKPLLAHEKWRSGQFLFAGESLVMASSLFREALAELRLILPPEKSIQLALDRLLDSEQLANCRLQIGNFEVQILESKIQKLEDPRMGAKSKIQNLDACIQQVAGATSNDPDTVAFLLRTVLSPFFKKQTMPYQEFVEAAGWRQGICPMCGFEPGLARLTYDDGRRILACSLCHTEWAFDRLRCPFCRGNGQPQLRHFTVDGDEAHRVDCCDRCQRYIKTVDERVLGHPAYLPVEDVITAHLDVLAREQEYR